MTINNNRLLPPPWVLVLIGAAALFWLLSELREMLVLLIVGYSLAYIIDPLVSKLEKRGLSRGIGVISVVSTVILSVVLLLLTAVPTIVKEFYHLSDNLPGYIQTSRAKLIPIIDQFGHYLPEKIQLLLAGESFEPALSLINPGLLQRVTLAVGSTLLHGYSLSLTVLNLFLLPFILYYISTDFHQFHRGILDLFPVLQRRSVSNIATEMNTYVSAFVRGQLIVCAILFFLFAIGLKIVGIQLWLLVSVIAGFGNMIPYVGTLVGILLASVMALVTFGDLSSLFQVWSVFVVVQFLEGTFITPRVMGQNVGMSPLTIILAIFVGGKLFGLLGIFLAIPGAAVCKVLARHLHTRIIHSVG
jgi:predicted PurR-regulated permease PerM